MFVGLRPDTSSHNLFLQGLLNRIVCLPLPSSSRCVPWEKIPQSKAIHFQRQRFTNVVPNAPSCYFESTYSFQNLQVLLKSRWPFPRFLDNSQPLCLPYKHGSVEREHWMDLRRQGFQRCSHAQTGVVLSPFCEWDSESIIFLSELYFNVSFFSLYNSPDGKIVDDLTLFLVDIN